MFQEACKQYHNVLATIYESVENPDRGIRSGQGFSASPIHVITSDHVVRPILDSGSSPIVVRNDGVFSCSLRFTEPATDVAVLKFEKRLKTFEASSPTNFPKWPGTVIKQGMSLGYLTLLWRDAPGRGMQPSPYFVSAHASYLTLNDAGKIVWVLDGGFCELGFSGSPVFIPTGEIMGLVNGVIAAKSIIPAGRGLSFNFPIVSSIHKIPPDVCKEIFESAAQKI
jgi:hypothetical protein